jgi:L-seryl-tRNA(Ser) seleniumtransferase
VQATVGGGSLPGEMLPSWALVLTPADGEGIDTLARRLRVGDPGIFGRIDQDRLLLDLRTVLPEDDEILLRSLRHTLGM